MIVSIHRWTRVSSFHEFITPFPFQTTKQHFSRPSSSNIRKKKKKNILSSKFKLENLRKIVNRGTFRKKSIVFHEAERTIYNLRDGRLDQEMRRLLVPDSDFRARSLHQRQCKIHRILRQSVPLSHDSSNETLNGRIASVNLILNDTPVQRRRSPDRGNESNLLNIASDDDKRHGYGIQDFVDSRSGENT